MQCDGGEKRNLKVDHTFCCLFSDSVIRKKELMPRSLCNAVREFIERSSP